MKLVPRIGPFARYNFYRLIDLIIDFVDFKIKVKNIEERNQVLQNLDSEYSSSYVQEILALKSQLDKSTKVEIFIFSILAEKYLFLALDSNRL